MTENLRCEGEVGQDHLTMRQVLAALRALKRGDFDVRLPDDYAGIDAEVSDTFNDLVAQLKQFGNDLGRLRGAVGHEGRTSKRLRGGEYRGEWAGYVTQVNDLLDDLTAHTDDMARVITAVARGDLHQKIEIAGADDPVQGNFLKHASALNEMVDKLGRFCSEVTRVARKVGVNGELGAQATVPGVSGAWKELTENVNIMATNLTTQVREIARVTTAVAQGDLSKSVNIEVKGEILELKNTINTMVDQLGSFADEVTRVAREVGTEGRLGGQARVKGVSGIWRELTENVNSMANNLTQQVRNIADVSTAIAKGDLSRQITVDAQGEILELKNTINTMVDQLGSFASEVTRVAREVGTEGRLGGQAEVKGVSGTWRELTDNVNVMADNLTEQVRGIARVVTAVANGDLKQQLSLEASGEIATLVRTINDMIGTLSLFAEQVSGVAREVGVEGELGGQADVPGAAGVWRDLTNNVNELAGNLTLQVRAIGDVATAVTKGDLSQSIDVEAQGEVALLKDNINQMICTLRETTRANEEQDWLKTNLTRFTRMLQGQRDLFTVAEQVLFELAELIGAQHGAFYMARREDGETVLKLFASYAMKERKKLSNRIRLGEGLLGQAARVKKRIEVKDVPEDYVVISSSLGSATPNYLVVVPVLFESEVKGVMELATVGEFTPNQLAFIDQLMESLGIVVATIEATMRTDELLRESQGMAEELQTQQEELQQTNEELEEKARELTSQKDQVERKNQQVELARQELEEKAEQLALTSKYKSQFLANMSHELRTPLNSLLILARQLADDPSGRLDPKQIEFAETIHQSGADLLAIINEILDLARIESGTIAIEPAEVEMEDLEDYVERTFRQVAQEKDLQLRVSVSARVPSQIVTDDMRLRQVLRNLLSNAIKFTDSGSVSLEIDRADGNGAEQVAFAVVDTGIGIPEEKHQIIFEAFQQADGGTSRRYGGTGLGLAISREIARLLGGDLTLESEPGKGSTFVLTLPARYVPAADDHSGLAAAPDRAGRQEPSPSPLPAPPRPASAAVTDDRYQIAPGERVILVIEDDSTFAKTLLSLAREHGFKAVASPSGEEAINLARTLQPDAITLDLKLPDMDGWVLLDRLKHDPKTRHIPVHIVSVVDVDDGAYYRGAVAVLQKPVEKEDMDVALAGMIRFAERRMKRLLIVEDDDTQRRSIVELIGNGDVESVSVSSGEEALEALEEGPFDCMVLDLSLPGMSGIELIERIKERDDLERLPIIVYTGKELTRDEETSLSRVTDTIIVKDVRSPERLLDETSLFLHRVESNLPEDKRKLLRSLAHDDPALKGKQILVVDDDVRNIFAITAVLERHEMEVAYAENGNQALERLEEMDHVDAVLMDVMMPEMDGYEATRRIRKMPDHANLPVIALTAKAMKGDREKCIEAGASDYVTKPVDPDQLISLLRVWLYRQ